MTRLPFAIGLCVALFLSSTLASPDASTAAEDTMLGAGPTAGGTQVTLDLPVGLRFSQFVDSAESRFATTQSGELYAWGVNDNGELGDGSAEDRISPTRIVGSLEYVTVQDVVNAGDATYALDSTGGVHSWGLNTSSQLGDGTALSRSTPSRVIGIPIGVVITHIYASSGSAYALSSDGRLFAWGSNASGRLGDGTTITRSNAVEVTGFPPGAAVEDLIVGSGNVFALTADGGLYSWGINANGILGDGTTTSRSSPTLVLTMEEGDQTPRFQTLGLQAFLLTRTGKVYSWGANVEGLLGNGTSAASLLPVELTFPGNALVEQLEVPFAVSTTGALFGWGPNLDGQLGDGTAINRPSPVAIDGFPASTRIVQIQVSRSSKHAVALTSDGNVYAWGQNDDGQVGDGTRVDKASPVAVEFVSLAGDVAIDRVAIIAQGAFAVSTDGRLYAWGENSFGRLGIGFSIRATSPRQLSTAADIVTLIAGARTGYALSSTGDLLGWGYDPVGNGTTFSEYDPVYVDGVDLVSVTFAGVEATSIERVARQAALRSPANPIGVVDVVLDATIGGVSLAPQTVGQFEYGAGPTISGQPQAVLADSGSNAFFTASATGGQPMTATWWKVIVPNSQWVSVTGATITSTSNGSTTTSSMSLPASLELSGTQYIVRFTNRFGEAESQTADLTVQQAQWLAIPTPVIDGQAVPGRSLSPSVGPWAPEPQSLSYRWLRNGTQVAGSMNYLVQASDVGSFITLEVTASRTGYLDTTTTSAPVLIREEGEVDRWAGTNRYETSAEISAQSQPPGVPVVFIANGTNFPDALSGAAVAGQLGGPVLLSPSTALPPAIITELQRLNPARIVILGGSGVISDAIEGQLDAYTTGNVDRWAGTNRYETSAEISAQSQPPGVPVVFIANGTNFPDALSGAAVAGQLGGPVLLSPSTALPPAIITELQRLNPARIVILGGSGVISNAVNVQLEAL